jgi:ABC-type phosphate/phosphonate transport system permease subunit
MTVCLISLIATALGLLIAMAIGLSAQHNFMKKLSQPIEEDKQ